MILFNYEKKNTKNPQKLIFIVPLLKNEMFMYIGRRKETGVFPHSTIIINKFDGEIGTYLLMKL